LFSLCFLKDAHKNLLYFLFPFRAFHTFSVFFGLVCASCYAAHSGQSSRKQWAIKEAEVFSMRIIPSLTKPSILFCFLIHNNK
jgi:hypothetical protein